MKIKVGFIACALTSAVMAQSAMAATEAEKRKAIDDGLAYLAGTQNANGSFDGGGLDYQLAQTGSAVLAFLEEKPNWGSSAGAYQTVVDKGLDFLLSNASVVSISAQPAGNPDGDGNGVGVKLYPGGINNRDTYVTGIALPAIASSGTPTKPVTVGPLAGRTDGTGPGGAWTHRDVVQNVVDYYAYGQSDPATGNNRGGWRYYANYGNSDQSTTQWPVISSLYATKMGVSTPGFVKSELSNWVSFIQNPITGAAGYQSPFSPLGELNETGALLIMQDYLGLPTSNARVQQALAYINANWTQFANSTWDGNFGHPYAMWAIYKGLELGVGKGDTTAITNLLTDCGASRGATDVGDVCNWWEDYNEHLVTTQNGDGSWTGYSSWPTALATPWYINILAGTVIPDDGGTVPAPATIVLLAAGLLGLRRAQRRANA